MTDSVAHDTMKSSHGHRPSPTLLTLVVLLLIIGVMTGPFMLFSPVVGLLLGVLGGVAAAQKGRQGIPEPIWILAVWISWIGGCALWATSVFVDATFLICCLACGAALGTYPVLLWTASNKLRATLLLALLPVGVALAATTDDIRGVLHRESRDRGSLIQDALAHHHEIRGQYPEELGDLVPTFLPELPSPRILLSEYYYRPGRGNRDFTLSFPVSWNSSMTCHADEQWYLEMHK